MLTFKLQLNDYDYDYDDDDADNDVERKKLSKIHILNPMTYYIKIIKFSLSIYIIFFIRKYKSLKFVCAATAKLKKNIDT